MALIYMYAQAQGSWVSLLRVGANNPALSRIEAEIGPVRPRDAIGHDAQITYLIARDPFGAGRAADDISAFDNNGPAYRYRRIFMPLLAGGFGEFGGRLTLTLLVALGAAGVGLSFAAVADLAFQQNFTGSGVLLASINAGALTAAMYLMVDTVALGCALCGIALVGRERYCQAAIALACAALTKETYVLVPLSLAAWELSGRRYRTAAIGMTAIIPAALWSAWTAWTYPGGAGGDGNLGLPFAGLTQAMRHWIRYERSPLELVLAAFSLLTFAGTALCLVRFGRTRFTCIMVPWLVLGLCSSLLVWIKPNNAARSFAILWPLVVLQLARAGANRNI